MSPRRISKEFLASGEGGIAIGCAPWQEGGGHENPAIGRAQKQAIDVSGTKKNSQARDLVFAGLVLSKAMITLSRALVRIG